ncbi:hypothetical protein COEREDRAFT_11699 [Coemansia reversa NRRL 1564]|uniref:Uncharacterized protein n=1 Tax=Coemansia reversa (strain ATCC 12441 / NRRL 1564) TaxID=763665 RepID=A0A2G5B2G1_COERN|nr:hypothetical protein COEREDRAFT_11699 [Coemansia reversa NRRL 1564]|eukprot:PIA13200.1 hypothetical protein COEREDRAFT_11699 [Coemansia reversa NRRL 1564]
MVYGGCHDDCCHKKPHHCKRQQNQDDVDSFPSANTGNSFLPDDSFGIAPGGTNDGQFPDTDASGGFPGANTGSQLPAENGSQQFPSNNANGQLPNGNFGSQFPSDGSADLIPGSGSNGQNPNGATGNQFPNESAGSLPGNGVNEQNPSGGIQFPGENNQQQQPTNNQQFQPADNQQTLNNLPGAAPIDAPGASEQGSETQSIPATLFDDLPGFLGITFPGQSQQSTTPGMSISTKDINTDEPSGTLLENSTEEDDDNLEPLDEDSLDEQSTSGADLPIITTRGLGFLSIAVVLCGF